MKAKRKVIFSFVVFVINMFTCGKTEDTEKALILTISEAFKCSNIRQNESYLALSPARFIQVVAVLKHLNKESSCENRKSSENFDVMNPATWNFCAVGECNNNSECSCYRFITGSNCEMFTGNCWLLYCTLHYCNSPNLGILLFCQCNFTKTLSVSTTSGIYWYDEGLETKFRPAKTYGMEESFSYFIIDTDVYRSAVEKAAKQYGGTRELINIIKSQNKQINEGENFLLRLGNTEKISTREFNVYIAEMTTPVPHSKDLVNYGLFLTATEYDNGYREDEEQLSEYNTELSYNKSSEVYEWEREYEPKDTMYFISGNDYPKDFNDTNAIRPLDVLIVFMLFILRF